MRTGLANRMGLQQIGRLEQPYLNGCFNQVDRTGSRSLDRSMENLRDANPAIS